MQIININNSNIFQKKKKKEHFKVFILHCQPCFWKGVLEAVCGLPAEPHRSRSSGAGQEAAVMLVHGQAAPGELQDAAQPADQGQRGHPVEGAEAGHAEDGRGAGRAGTHGFHPRTPGQPSTATGPGEEDREGWLPSPSGRVPSSAARPCPPRWLPPASGEQAGVTCPET